MIFITLGSQKFQFNRLLIEVDKLIENKQIDTEVFAQIGSSDYIPKNFKSKNFLDKEEYDKYMGLASIVVTHGGTGAIIGAVKLGKKVVAVPRLAKYGEHVDDHQIQLLKQFEEMNLIVPCYETESLYEKLIEAENMTAVHYESNTQQIISDIEGFIEGM